MALWADYADPADGSLGSGVILDPSAHFAGFAETPTDRLLLVKVKPGETVRYYAGGGWNKSGDFPDAASWQAYLTAWASRAGSPLKIAVTVAP